jgi:glutathione S-transferase
VYFETYEVDLQNKSEEFLAASPTGKVLVVVADSDSLYESNVVNQYLDEVFESPRLLPEDPKKRAYTRIWMASAADDFFPAVFVAGVGRVRGFSDDRISEALEKLKAALGALEERLWGREYLADKFSLADIAHAGTLARLRELAEMCDIALEGYPNVAAWMQRIEAREVYKAAG